MTRRLLSLALAAAMAPPVIAGTVGCAWCIWVADVARAQRAKAAPVPAADEHGDGCGCPAHDAGPDDLEAVAAATGVPVVDEAVMAGLVIDALRAKLIDRLVEGETDDLAAAQTVDDVLGRWA